ncbi:hypothetical protein ACWF0M_06275 [Kribbella sp. NPDC055110]
MDSGRRLRRRVAAVARTILSAFYLAVAVFILVIALVDLPGSVRAARNEGVPGTFTAVRKECKPVWEKGGGGCSYFGDFVSRDGAVRLTDVFYEGDPGDIGDSVAAQYVGTTDPPRVHKVSSDEWVFVGLFILGSSGYLVFRVWSGLRTLHRRRVRRASSASAG